MTREEKEGKPTSRQRAIGRREGRERERKKKRTRKRERERWRGEGLGFRGASGNFLVRVLFRWSGVKADQRDDGLAAGTNGSGMVIRFLEDVDSSFNGSDTFWAL